MSGDADEWTASFSATECKIITNKWDTIYVTNTKAEIKLDYNVGSKIPMFIISLSYENIYKITE